MLLTLLIAEVNGDGEMGCFGELYGRIVALGDANVEAAEWSRVEEFQEEAHKANAPRFLDVVDEKIIMVMVRLHWTTTSFIGSHSYGVQVNIGDKSSLTHANQH